ncbi:hypothetical protein NKR23_g6079 [Pleurostoma richardsiae]|uniref:Xylanolytic transcriptional activator regulatory domain-containing protein n=1 Tax=Pleurostoma richardsiae TaxID=41990 RepID=A0AA38RRR2_9PEZI|nr:hypothetical protein NKR23_g6079 [Pleurostoma richardsiae]
MLKKHAPHLQLDEAEDEGPPSHESYSGYDGKEGRLPGDRIFPSSVQTDRLATTDLAVPKENSSSPHFTDATGIPSDSVKGQWSPSPFPMAPQAQQAGSKSRCDDDDDDVDDVEYWNRLQEECANNVFLKPPPSTKDSKDPVAGPSGKGAPPPGQSEGGPVTIPLAPPPLQPYEMGFPFQQPVVTMPPPLLSVRQRQVCWKRYVENVDPVVKILHKPTMELVSVRDANSYAMSPSTVALIQAVCLLAIVSMSDEDVSLNLEGDREALMRSCASRTEQALMAANFLDARDLSTLQALLLFLYYLKYQEDSRLYSLSCVAMCLAARMGLNRDAHASGLSRLEVELRRRFWWQLINLVDHPDNSGLEGFMALTAGTDARLPLNVDDSDLPMERRDAGPSQERSGFTESSFCLMQYQITQAFNQIRSDRSQAADGQRDIALDRAERRLHSSREVMESKYLPDRASPRSPFGKFAIDTIAMVLAKRRLLTHISPDFNRQGSPLAPGAAKDRLFLLGIQILELSRALQTGRGFERWRWLSTTYFQWAAATFVVRDLAVRPRSPATKRAWHVIDGILDQWPGATSSSPRASALRALIAEAARHRDAEAMWQVGPTPPTAGLGANNNGPFAYSSEVPRQGMAGRERKRQAPGAWAAGGSAPAGQQHPDFLLFGQAMDMDNYFIPDLAFDETSFGFNLELA